MVLFRQLPGPLVIDVYGHGFRSRQFQSQRNGNGIIMAQESRPYPNDTYLMSRCMISLCLRVYLVFKSCLEKMPASPSPGRCIPSRFAPALFGLTKSCARGLSMSPKYLWPIIASVSILSISVEMREFWNFKRFFSRPSDARPCVRTTIRIVWKELC